ncbi:vacuolar processing enzyme [Dunaliella salina]|uniref:Vacuolar processing enzyme n=1 Tax=Dunaliella salina TaxID=3046 RepID=A0ABQ7GIH7_DUNSA|nr:vacuolar processing enzyme [Dunaliella salina]|eukprot:KAF5834424.1 vacuolar processing enzyme [Dunaliella salina]
MARIFLLPVLLLVIPGFSASRPGFRGFSEVQGGRKGDFAVHVLTPGDSPERDATKEGTSASPQPSQRWALLVAGSSGWYNYRHQADVCHAYHLIKEGGVHTANIVTMMYGDIAHHADNPFPGKIFNRPGGPDVFQGVAIDYRGDEVNVNTVLAVLEGNKDAVKSLGTGKVIDSGPNDEVFVFYSDHGSPGVLGMPSGSMLYADQLLGAIRRKRAAHGYKEMSMYIEACESGSLFQGMLEDDLQLYVTTAANANESSWGTYCPGLHGAAPPQAQLAGNGSKELDTCLGDLFSVAWMEDSEEQNPLTETLRVQFDHVSQRTSANYTYKMGSHVQRFGQVSAMEADHVGDFIGYPSNRALSRLSSTGMGAELRGPQQHSSVSQREADLVPLRFRVANARTPRDRQKAEAELNAVLKQRAGADAAAEGLAHKLFMHPETSDILIQNHGWQAQDVFIGAPEHGQPASSFLTQLVSGAPKQRPPQAPLVDSWDCLREMERAWAQAYGPFDQYSMRHMRLLANLCNSGLNDHAVRAVSATTATAGATTEAKEAVPETVTVQ